MDMAPQPKREDPTSIALEASRVASGAAHAADHADRWALEITRLAQDHPDAGLGVVVPVALRAAELAARSSMLASEARRRAQLLVDGGGERTRTALIGALRAQVRVATRARRTAEAAAREAEAAVASVSQAA
jgi:hypothetical protein